jgi:hypothetical protein
MKFKERLRINDPEIDLDDNFAQISNIERDIGKCIYHHLVTLFRTEGNASILSLAQLTMTTSFLRILAIDLGPFDTEEVINVVPAVAAMQMTARLAFEGLTTETKRRDILDWSVNWYKRQMELDYGKIYKTVAESESVGHAGIVYNLPAISKLKIQICWGIIS